jgi:hypothetical protein
VIDFGGKFIHYFLKARPFHSYKYFFRYHNNGVALKKRVNLLQIFDYDPMKFVWCRFVDYFL